MKILGVIGSPRRQGNTHLLVQSLLGAARDIGAQVDTWFLRDLEIQECDGCHTCWDKGVCSKADDMRDRYARLAEFDAIVFGTPVYWYGPTALMKGFLDRFVYFNCDAHRPLIRGKRAALVTPFEDRDLETAAPLVAMFEKSLAYVELVLVDKLLVPGVTRRGEVAEHADALGRARELGRRLVTG